MLLGSVPQAVWLSVAQYIIEIRLKFRLLGFEKCKTRFSILVGTLDTFPVVRSLRLSDYSDVTIDCTDTTNYDRVSEQTFQGPPV